MFGQYESSSEDEEEAVPQKVEFGLQKVEPKEKDLEAELRNFMSEINNS